MKPSLMIAYAMKKKAKKMAEGGEAGRGDGSRNYKQHGKEMRKYDHQKQERGVHEPRGIGGMNKEKFGESHAGYSAREKSPEFNEQAKAEHHMVLAEQRAMPKPKIQGLAHGGEVGEPEEDMVSRILKKHCYSEGGEVANDTPMEADFKENDFDDLALDDGLEFHETGENSGDELGNAQEDHDREDIVRRILHSQKKKDKNPRPA